MNINFTFLIVSILFLSFSSCKEEPTAPNNSERLLGAWVFKGYENENSAMEILPFCKDHPVLIQVIMVLSFIQKANFLKGKMQAGAVLRRYLMQIFPELGNSNPILSLK